MAALAEHQRATSPREDVTQEPTQGMSSTRSSATAQAELEALLLLAAGIDGRRAAVHFDAAFVECVVRRRQGHPVTVARADSARRGGGRAEGAAELTVPAGVLAGPLAGRLAREVILEPSLGICRVRSATSSRSLIAASSSTCSSRNHSRNCSLW